MKRTWGTGWGSEETVESSVSSYSFPQISYDSTNDAVYVFWANNSHIYYRRKTSSGWESVTDWIDETDDGLTANDQINSYFKDYDGSIGVAYLDGTSSPYNVTFAYLSVAVAQYSLNLRIYDWDLTDTINGAYVYVNGSLQTSDSNGWANYTNLSAGTYLINVSYYGFPVNGTFTINLSGDTTLNVRCKLYDVYVQTLPNNQQGILYLANVTVFNSTCSASNKIATATTNQTGYAYLTNLPNATLTVTVYAPPSLVIANVTRTPTSDEQTLTAVTCNQNYAYNIVAWKIRFED